MSQSTSVQGLRPAPDSALLPPELVTPSSKLVYLYLSSAGPCHIDDLSSSLGMNELAVIPIVTHLSDQGVVRRDGDVIVPTV